MNLYNYLTVAWDWSKKWDLPINPAKCNIFIIRLKVPVKFFFPDGPATLISVSKLVKDLGVHTDNVSALFNVH